MHSIADSQNGFSLKANTFVETSCENWVARMGDALKQEITAPKGVKISKIEFTLEDGPVEDDSSENEVSKRDVSKRSVPNKAVTGADNK